MMLELAKNRNFSREQVVEKMCHNQLVYLELKTRFIRKGYYADLLLYHLIIFIRSKAERSLL